MLNVNGLALKSCPHDSATEFGLRWKGSCALIKLILIFWSSLKAMTSWSSMVCGFFGSSGVMTWIGSLDASLGKMSWNHGVFHHFDFDLLHTVYDLHWFAVCGSFLGVPHDVRGKLQEMASIPAKSRELLSRCGFHWFQLGAALSAWE